MKLKHFIKHLKNIDKKANQKDLKSRMKKHSKKFKQVADIFFSLDHPAASLAKAFISDDMLDIAADCYAIGKENEL